MATRPLLQRCFELLSALPLPALYRLADAAALLLGATPNQVSRQTRANFALCFADLDPRRRRRLYRDSIRHTCYTMFELPAVWHWPLERLLARVDERGVCAEFRASGRCRLVLAPHLGSWEMLAQWLGANGDAMFLYKKQKSAALDRYIAAARARGGGTPVSTKKRGLRELLRGVAAGKTIMILPDQKPARRKHRIAANFFGYLAPTMPLVQMLCAKARCDVFLAAMCRSEPAGRFELVIRPLQHARLAAAEADSAQYMNDAIERLVRDYLAQYQWGYRRFSDPVYRAHERGRAA